MSRPGVGVARPAVARVPALLAEARARWRRATLLRAACVALAAGVAVAVLLIVIDSFLSLPADARSVLRLVPLAAALTPIVVALARAYPGPDDRRVALLVEERVPELENVLATALEAHGEDGTVARAFAARAERRVAALGGAPAVPARLRAPARVLAGGLLVGVAALALAPDGPTGVWARWAHLAETSRAAPGVAAADSTASTAPVEPVIDPRFGELVITVTPPAYTGLSAREAPTDEVVTALIGSRIRIEGARPEGSARVRATIVGEDESGGDQAERVGEAARVDSATGAGPTARAGANSPVVRVTDDVWSAEWTLAAGDRGLSLEALADEVLARHILPLAPQRDRAPVVELTSPGEDLVLAAPSGEIPVRAKARDDYGIAEFGLTWIRSRGSGESFSFEEGEWSWDAVRREADEQHADFTLDVAAAELESGDVLHLRAVARDHNDVDGPGLGVSPTRVIRIADPEQMEEATTLIGFPLEAEREPILSQRMIILMTEQLRDTLAELSAEERLHEAQEIADEQGRLRSRVGDQIFTRAVDGVAVPDEGAGFEEVVGAVRGADTDPRDAQPSQEEILERASEATGLGTPEEVGHDHDEDPILDMNHGLLSAYNAMWSAETELRVVDPVEALPYQYEALEILQEQREAERVFLRGQQRVAPIDVDDVRGTGTLDELAVAPRSAGEALATGAEWLGEVEELATRLEQLDARTASLELSELAARVLGDTAADPDAALLLGRAAEAASAGQADSAAARVDRARARLRPRGASGAELPIPTAVDGVSAQYFERLGTAASATQMEPARAASSTESGTFVFATARYASGDWDSSPLLPTNVIHAVAQYTDIPVAPEGVAVDLSSREVFRYPFIFLTGHLPVRFTDEEARNLEAYVDRGGFLFIDDHNHDIDGAFHRTVTAELERIFGAGSLEELSNDHELYTTFFEFDDGPPTTEHELNGWGDGLIHEHLFAVERNGRIGVLYSNKDYSSEWNYHAANKRFLGIDNTRFGVNIIVYALTR